MPAQLFFAPETLHVLPWPDEVLDHLGHDPRSGYAEDFWLPVLGPSTLWLLRRVAAGFDFSPEGFDLDLGETARSLGLGDRSGRNSPFVRSLNRCVQFGMGYVASPDVVHVRRRLPAVGRQHLRRQSPALQARHEAWTAQQLTVPGPEHQLRRARRLALSLFEVGADWGAVERQLLRWRYPLEQVHDALAWAQAQQALRPQLEEGHGSGLPA